MNIKTIKIKEKKIIIYLKDRICETSEELIQSKYFFEILQRCVYDLKKIKSPLLLFFSDKEINDHSIESLRDILLNLVKNRIDYVLALSKDSEEILKNKLLLNDFVEYLYNYWRDYSRFIICDSENDTLDKRPYRTFSSTIVKLTDLIRQTYRDIQENITLKHPRIFRQVSAGASNAAITTPSCITLPSNLDSKINSINVIRQILIYPPLIINPPMNKRTGVFEQIYENPLTSININKDEWVCFPAKVGKLLILVYFHEKFYELGFALANMFELSEDEDLLKKPDAIYMYGVDEHLLKKFSTSKTIFYDDTENNVLVAAIPNDDSFGYFGYLKKMILTLHNIKVMKQRNMPFHGALIKLYLTNDTEKTVLLIGDTGAGKSETLEALRIIGASFIKEITIIADDMGSIELDKNNNPIGYGSETGAFLRLDDLQPGFAFGKIDRSIIMSPNKVNARILIPVTDYETIIKGSQIDYVLYANNYEQIDEAHPIIEKFNTSKEALHVFTEGCVMSKGTTTSTGLTYSYFANVFGPPQYKDLHEAIAKRYFDIFFKKNIFVGQFRTRLGLKGYEQKGPKESAKKLLELLIN